MAKARAIGGNRRTTELLLLIAAMPVVLVLFATGVLNDGLQVNFFTLAVPIGLIAAFVVSHIAVRLLAPNADPVILPLTFLLSGIGITFVMRLAPDLATNQLILLFVGVVLMILTLAIVRSVGVFARYKYLIMLAGIVLLLLPGLVGVDHLGSKIWLSIAGFSFQPGEIAKVLIVIFLACYLSDNRELLTVGSGPLHLPNMATLVPLLIMWGLAMVVMVWERDLGSAILIFGIFVVMLYATTGRKSYVFFSIGLIVVGGVLAYVLFDHIQVRFMTWLDPFAYAHTGGYQLVQAIYSMADGGLFGTGLGRGFPTLIPIVESDFIFAAMAEEIGLLGASGVLIAYLIFGSRGFATASRAKTDMTSLLAVGLTTAIVLQAFVIVGGVTRVIPLTGLTLPFMSQGGSSLIASFIIVGLLLRAGDEGVAPDSTAELALHDSPAANKLGRVALGHRLTVLTVGFAVLFAVAIAALTYTQVIRAEYYQTLPTNNHTIARMQHRPRGSILSSDGVTLAQSVEQEDGSYERVYPQGQLAAHVLGYTSIQYGSAGVELSYGDQLVGDRGYATFEDAVNALAGTPTAGNDVTLTIDSTVQEVAEQQLSGVVGAIVVMDPETGAILAEASSPTYDVNDVETVLSSESTAGELYNRATQALYAPGSSFKVVTLATALEHGTVTPDTVFPAPATIEIGGGPITNFDSEAWDQLTVAEATWYSSNTVFAQIADQLGASLLVSGAEKFGFNDNNLPIDFTLRASLMPEPGEMTQWETAWAGVGQPVGEHESPAGPQVTAMQMALVAAGVANDGVVMRPYVVKSVSSSSGQVLTSTVPEIYGTSMSAQTAASVRSILTGVVEQGTGTGAAVYGTTVAGKTGTAETSKETDDAWFIGMAPADDPKVVVAVIIEEGGQGGRTAAPKAGECLAAALQARGLL